MSQCHQCNASTDDDAKFCSSCGNVLKTKDASSQKQQKNNFIKALKICFSLAFIGAIVLPPFIV